MTDPILIPTSGAPRPALPQLVDPFGRAIEYLRISVTDRCDFRCVYCMSENMHFLPKRDLLTLEELDRLASAFVARGTRKLRITGGEPLVRRDIMHLFRSLSRHLASGALDELTCSAPSRVGAIWSRCSPAFAPRRPPGWRSRSMRWR
jgi:GTP 3',8-cyclase